MMRWMLIAIFFCFSISASAQQNSGLIDSLKKKLSVQKTPEERFETLSLLSRVTMNISLEEADRYARMMTEQAELSRNRQLMVRALLIQGERFSYFMGKKDAIQKSIDYYNQALALARKSKLEKEMTMALLGLSGVHLGIPELDKALNFTTQASSIISGLKDDSLEVSVYNSFGNVYQLKKDRLLALRNYLTALRTAEDINKKDPVRFPLLRNCYINLAAFYSDIKEYDKAIDYAIKGYETLFHISDGNAPHMRVTTLNYIGSLYAQKKNADMSVYYYEQSIRLADSLKFEPLKVPAYVSILNQYVSNEQYQKALDYFNSNPHIRNYLSAFGFPHIIDQAYASIYTSLRRFDSARYYFDKAMPQFEASATPSNKMNFYAQFGKFYKVSGDYPKAVEYYLKARAIADQTGSLEAQQNIAKNLDTVYSRMGDYQNSYSYSNLYHKYKDSLQKLTEEKDLMQMEIADEQYREARKKQEELESERRRHNVQYMAITVAIAVVFLILVLLGILQVSVSTIKIMGFFAFIFLFEFIILIADHKIHAWTHGEPLKVIAIKIVLIAMLLPFHHWLEHKVVTYLTSRRLIIPTGKGFWSQILAKTKTHAPAERPTFAQNSEH